MTNRDDPFHSHGDQGQQPPDGKDFSSGGNPDAQEFDFFWYHLIEKVNDFIAEFNRLDSDDDGVVDEADTANLYKSNDIDSNGDGVVDEADTANLFKGNDIDSDGDGQVDAADSADTTPAVNDSDVDSQYFLPSGSATIKEGDASPLEGTELADGETLSVQSGMFRLVGGGAAPNGTDMILATYDGSSWNLENVVFNGDGSTVFAGETGSPIQSYTNTTGSPQQVGLFMDNGNFDEDGDGSGAGSAQDLQGRATLRVN